jgi:hypothetical protein
LSEVVLESAVDECEVADCEPLLEPVLLALLELEVSPPVAVAVLLLEELPLPEALWVEVPALPPVAVLLASPVLPGSVDEFAVDELDPPLLVELESALPSFSAYASE